MCSSSAGEHEEEEGMKDPTSMHRRKRKRAFESMLDWSNKEDVGDEGQGGNSREQLEDKTLEETREEGYGETSQVYG